jgi:hypothetical protein
VAVSKLDQWGNKVEEYEPFVDRWLARLAAHEHTAWIVIAAAVVALGAGVVLWVL